MATVYSQLAALLNKRRAAAQVAGRLTRSNFAQKPQGHPRRGLSPGRGGFDAGRRDASLSASLRRNGREHGPGRRRRRVLEDCEAASRRSPSSRKTSRAARSVRWSIRSARVGGDDRRLVADHLLRPKFAPMFESLRKRGELPLATDVLLAISDFCGRYGLWVVGLMAIVSCSSMSA